MTTMNPARPMTALGIDRERVSHLAAIVAAVVFGGIGLVAIALGMSFPLALGVVAEQSLAVSASDLAVADRIADYWWILAALGALHLVALMTVLNRGVWGKRIAIVLAGAGAAGAAAAQIALVMSGAAFGDHAGVANGLALVYAVVVVSVVLIQPREEAR